MLHSIRRIGLVCAIILAPIVLVLIATYPRTATGAAEVGNISGPAAQTQSVIPTGGPAVSIDPVSPPATGLAPQGGISPLPLPGIPGYMWNYSAKFVCGFQDIPQAGVASGEPPVKPANYATEINIHNYNYKGIVIRKKVVLVVEQGNVIGREPAQQGPRTIVQPDIGPDNVMMDDCNAIWTMLYTQTLPLPSVMPLMIGYLVVISPLDLDIDAVYTAAQPGRANASVPGGGLTGIAIDVVRVLGKRVFVPGP